MKYLIEAHLLKLMNEVWSFFVGCYLTFLCGMELLNLLYSSEAVIGSGPLMLISAKRSDLSKPPQNHS